MSGDLKQYAPTARRLQKLRQTGVAPTSSAVGGVCALAGMTILALAAGKPLQRALAQLLAEGLTGPAKQLPLPFLLARHLLLGGALVVALAVAVAAAGWAARALQAGGALKPPWAGRQRFGKQDWPAAALAGVGLAGLISLFAGFMGQYRAAGQWAQLTDPRAVLTLWLRVLCLFGGLATLHLLWTRAAFLRQAMLTHRELRDERKETEGSWLKGQLRHRRDARGSSRSS